MSKDVANKDYLMDGQNVDPNPTRARTFNLGSDENDTSQKPLDDTEKQRRRRLAEGILAGRERDWPGLTVEEVEEMMY